MILGEMRKREAMCHTNRGVERNTFPFKQPYGRNQK
jgi:hypothetical protein